jgi:mono/diheme cytochrome c family protein
MNVAQWLRLFRYSNSNACLGSETSDLWRNRARLDFLGRRLAGILGVCLALIGAGVWFAWTLKTRGFSAREKPSRFESFVARHARSLATPTDAKKMKNPMSPTPLDIAEGRDHFADHCAICHANDGGGKTEMGRNMYPPAPDMREKTQQLTDGELFYIIKNGIRFTGMPGWGGEDEDNWKLVLFIRHLPQLSPKELELMKEINGQGPQ